jgi:8-amino-7-oxononanoate synthase
MDVFDKCHAFHEAHDARAEGIYPYFMPLSAVQGVHGRLDGRRLLLMSRNDYLGLSSDLRVHEAAECALRRFGTSAGASRFVSGTLDVHEQLECALAALLGKEAALVFGTGLQTNLGVVATVAGSGDTIIADRSVHASALDGARLSRARLHRFAHNSVAGLDRLLCDADSAGGTCVVIDGVYSMEGDQAPLDAIVAHTRAHGARLLVDDAHGIGVVDRATGRGTAAQYGVSADVDLIVGTLSKSLAAAGGFVAGDAEVIDYIRHTARTMIFSGALSPMLAAAALAALEIMQREPERRARLWRNTDQLRHGLNACGFDTGASCTPIIPIVMASRAAGAALWRQLYDNGILAGVFVPPATPDGMTVLRFSVSALHTEDQLSHVLDVCAAGARMCARDILRAVAT